MEHSDPPAAVGSDAGLGPLPGPALVDQHSLASAYTAEQMHEERARCYALGVAAGREQCAKAADRYHFGDRYDADATGSEVASWLAAEFRA